MTRNPAKRSAITAFGFVVKAVLEEKPKARDVRQKKQF